MITNGGIAYEMCRPISIYNMWFFRNVGGRFAETITRGIPILMLGALIPNPYRLIGPNHLITLIPFFLALFLGFFVTVAFLT